MADESTGDGDGIQQQEQNENESGRSDAQSNGDDSQGTTQLDFNDEELQSSFRREEPALSQDPPHTESPTVTSSSSSDTRSITKRAFGTVKAVFPKLEPLPWIEFLRLSSLCAIPAASYILLFTKMGFGLDVFTFISTHLERYAASLAAALAAFILVLYLLDFSYWDSKWGRVCRAVSWSLFLIGCVAVVLFLSGEYPFGPTCLYAVLTPIWLVLVKHVLYRKVKTRTYISWASGPLFFVSAVSGLVWFIWTFLRDENEWNEVARLSDAEEVGCEPNFEEYPECKQQDQSDPSAGDICIEITASPPNITFPEGCSEACSRVYDGCLNTFILWVGPLLLSLTFCFLSFFCTFLRSEDTGERDVINFGKLWLFLLFAMWLAAALAGVGSGVASALLALTLASFAGSVVFLSCSMSRQDRHEHTREYWDRLRAKYDTHLDAVRGLALLVVAPFAIVYVGLSFLNQGVRRLGLFRCSKSLADQVADDGRTMDNERRDWITKTTRRQVNMVKSWDRVKVYTFAIYWGMVFMTMAVVISKLVVLFLSWLVGAIQDFSLGAATGILIAVGLTMFLLPPVPGLPVYTTVGVVIVAIGRDILGLVGSLAYGVALSFVLKLLASIMQQKLIGENLSQFTAVRRFVGINTDFIRGARVILSDPGVSIAKVSVLIGGPDWPVSVLCGIMRLDLLPILIGTLPVIIITLPMTLGGSFLYMAPLEAEDGTLQYPWASALATTCFALTAASGGAAMLSAAFFLEQVVSSRQEEIHAVQIDEEVREAEEKDRHINEAYSAITQWDVLPVAPKSVITFSLGCMVASCFMVIFFSERCFVEYEVTNSIEDDLDGDWTNFFLPLGQAALIIFLVSCVLLFGFRTWAKRKASRLVQGGSRVHPEAAAAQEEADGEAQGAGSNEIALVASVTL